MKTPVARGDPATHTTWQHDAFLRALQTPLTPGLEFHDKEWFNELLRRTKLEAKCFTID